jgi:hypothetical protein
VQGFGDFNGDGTADMIMRNINTGDLQLYDIVNNQITNSLFLARSSWIVGSRASRPPRTRRIRSRVAQHEHWSIRGFIASNHIAGVRSASIGTSAAFGLAVDPPTGSGCSSYRAPPCPHCGSRGECRLIVWLVQSARVWVKAVMDVGRGDGRMASGNSELVKIAYYIPRGI